MFQPPHAALKMANSSPVGRHRGVDWLVVLAGPQQRCFGPVCTTVWPITAAVNPSRPKHRAFFFGVDHLSNSGGPGLCLRVPSVDPLTAPTGEDSAACRLAWRHYGPFLH